MILVGILSVKHDKSYLSTVPKHDRSYLSTVPWVLGGKNASIKGEWIILIGTFCLQKEDLNMNENNDWTLGALACPLFINDSNAESHADQEEELRLSVWLSTCQLFNKNRKTKWPKRSLSSLTLLVINKNIKTKWPAQSLFFLKEPPVIKSKKNYCEMG